MFNRRERRQTKKNLKKVNKIIDNLEPKINKALAKDDLSPKARQNIEEIFGELKGFRAKDTQEILSEYKKQNKDDTE